jgi:hypothetical protein
MAECTLEAGILATGEGRKVCVVHSCGVVACVGFIARGGSFEAEKGGFAFGGRTSATK